MGRSEELFERAKKVIPGGVNSPVRAFQAVGGKPRFIACAGGAKMTDADGNTYLDFVGSWGPMILGHGPPGTHIVDILHAIFVIEISPLGASDKFGRRPNRTKCPHRRIYAARDYLQGFLVQCF